MKWTEITGVDKNVDFKVKGLSETCRIIEQPTDFQRIAVVIPGGELIGASAWVYDKIIHAAPAGIIRLPPPLTDEQRTVLMSLYTLGARWIAKDETELMWAYKEKPLRGYKTWCSKPSTGGDMKIFDDAPVSLLISWSDPEPFDIGKALGVTL